MKIRNPAQKIVQNFLLFRNLFAKFSPASNCLRLLFSAEKTLFLPG